MNEMGVVDDMLKMEIRKEYFRIITKDALIIVRLPIYWFAFLK